MAIEPQQIRTRVVERCLLCGAAGNVLFDGFRDRSFSAPGEWSLRKCERPDCGLVWLDPVPVEEDIGKAYLGYYTHAQPEPGPSLVRHCVWGVWMSYLGMRYGYRQGTGPAWRKVFAPLALLHPGGRDELDGAAMHLPAPKGPAKVLDVGCGSGVLLARMKTLGWDVEGVEVDPEAVRAANKRGLPVRLGTLQQQCFPDNHFDAVYSAHVIEHVYDPLSLLAESRRVLKPGGTLVFLTPNMESWGFRRYRAAWSNLDPPRHLVLFNPTNLRRAADQSGLKVLRLTSTVRTAWVYGVLTHGIQKTGRGEISELGKPASLLRGIFYQLRQRLAAGRDQFAGDELQLVATK